MTDLDSIAASISRDDAYARAALICSRQEAKALLARASDHGDAELERALLELAALDDSWTLAEAGPFDPASNVAYRRYVGQGVMLNGW